MRHYLSATLRLALVFLAASTSILSLDELPRILIKKKTGDVVPVILPSPQQVRWGSQFFTLNQKTEIVFTGESVRNRINAQRLAVLLNEQKGLRLMSSAAQNNAGQKHAAQNVIVITTPHSTLARELRPDSQQKGMPPEGYALFVDPHRVVIIAGEEKGGFYAAQTLMQMITAHNRGLVIREAEIVDWPGKSFRGAHVMMPGRADLLFYRRLIDLLARLKYNKLIIEVGGGMEYRRHPEINRGWEAFVSQVMSYPNKGIGVQESQGFEKNSIHYALGGGSFISQKEVRELIEYARSREIEVIPEVPSLSHSDYLLASHRELAERPDDPFPDTYCPSDPRTYKLLFDVMDEVIEVFRPKRLSIGHDEYYSIGLDDRCRGKKAPDLYAGDVTKLHDYLAARGIETMMWGEKLLNITTTEGKHYGGVERVTIDEKRNKIWVIPPTHEAIDRLPKDILILDWYWELSPFTQNYYQQHGYRSIFGNFTGTDFNFWKERSASPNLLGGVVSNWTVTKEYGFGHDGRIFNFLFSSEIFWNGHYTPARKSELRGSIAEIMPGIRNSLAGLTAPSSLPEKTFVPIDLTSAANLPVKGSFITSGDYDFSFLQTNEVVFSPVPFSLIDQRRRKDFAGVMIDADRQQHSKRLTVSDELSSIVFLHACLTEQKIPEILEALINPQAEVLGEYAINYADGSTEKIPLRYTVNIQSLREEKTAPYFTDASLRWEVKPLSGWDAPQQYALASYEWINPHPDKIIQTITFSSAPTSNRTRLFLFAVTGVKTTPPSSEMRQKVAERNSFLSNGAEDKRMLDK